MKTSELASRLGYEWLTAPEGAGAPEESPGVDSQDIAGVYTSDLLSDVMGHAPEEGILVTIQSHRNSVAVAALAGLQAIVICSRRPVPPDMLQAAQEEGIHIFRTDKNQFQVSVELGKALGL